MQLPRPTLPRPLLTLTIGLLLVAPGGCAKHGPKAAPVDAAVARQALKTTLDSWKKGATPASLQAQSPAITAQDMDWEAGFKLMGYQVVGDGKYDDANLRCPVQLTLQDNQGREVKKQVTYVVGTDPVITVFRELFP